MPEFEGRPTPDPDTVRETLRERDEDAEDPPHSDELPEDPADEPEDEEPH